MRSNTPLDSATDRGSSRTLLTNFEPASARKLLPFWDEPARKATFTLSVVIPREETAVSNMPIAAATSTAGYAGRPDRAAFRAFALPLLDPVTARLGSSPQRAEGSNLAVLRDQLAEARGELGDPAVVRRARLRVSDGFGSPADQRAALTVAAEHADAGEFDRLLARARSTHDPLEKLHVYEALGTVENAALAARLIALAIGGEMPTGVNIDVLRRLAEGHPDLVWDTAVPRFAEPSAAIPESARRRLAMSIARQSSESRRIAELRAYAVHDVPADARKPFEGAIATIRQNVRIAQQVLPELDAYIEAHTIH